LGAFDFAPLQGRKQPAQRRNRPANPAWHGRRRKMKKARKSGDCNDPRGGFTLAGKSGCRIRGFMA
jgi:hypothetical protein